MEKKKNLVIVESPAKSKTIEKYLGSDYKVVSSKGHIRDLSTKGKSIFFKELKKDVKEANKIYLASDPDREGEAISWHLFDTLKLKDKDYDRIEFHEITKPAVI